MTDWEHKFDHWCKKGLTAQQRSHVQVIRKLFGMHYCRGDSGGPYTSIEAAEIRLLQRYGHLEDEACAAFPLEELWVAALAKARAWSQSQLVVAEKLSDQQGEQT